MAHPLITIAMPVYNCERTVGEAIASILNQSFEDWELVVLDDGSRDNTVSAARRFSDPRIRVVEGGANCGLPARLNQIVAGCQSEFLARMDGDDIAYPRRLEIQLDMLRRNPGIDLLGGSILIFGRDYKAHGLRRTAAAHAGICGRPWSISNLPHMTWMGRAEWFRRHPYREWSTHAQDRDLLTRFRREAVFAAVPDVLVAAREEAPRWGKLRKARRQMLRTAILEGWRQRDWPLLFVTAPAELAKWGLDLAATSTGLGHRLLRHRVPHVDSGNAAEWREVLKQVRGRMFQETEIDCIASA